MNQLRKFLEIGTGTRQVGRVAYASDIFALPKPAIGLEWRIVKEFPAANEGTDPRLMAVFERAIKQGYALTRPAADTNIS